MYLCDVMLAQGILGFALSPGFSGEGSPFYVSYTYYDATAPGTVSYCCFNTTASRDIFRIGLLV